MNITIKQNKLINKEVEVNFPFYTVEKKYYEMYVVNLTGDKLLVIEIKNNKLKEINTREDINTFNDYLNPLIPKLTEKEFELEMNKHNINLKDVYKLFNIELKAFTEKCEYQDTAEFIYNKELPLYLFVNEQNLYKIYNKKDNVYLNNWFKLENSIHCNITKFKNDISFNNWTNNYYKEEDEITKCKYLELIKEMYKIIT
jgi:hypothetical protein